jgi:hypothetical protein
MADYEPPQRKCVDRCDEKVYPIALLSSFVVTGGLVYYLQINILFAPFIFIILWFLIWLIKRTVREKLYGESCPCRFF